MIFPILALAALTTALPSPQAGSGGQFVAVGNKYSGPGCKAQTLIFADPIFGNGNGCQALDRFGTSPPIVSYNTTSVSPGCSGKFSSFSSWCREEGDGK
jgi:hypothetical protein